MMRWLIFNVPFHAVKIGLAHGERRISCLPLNRLALAFQPEIRNPLQLFDPFSLSHRAA